MDMSEKLKLADCCRGRNKRKEEDKRDESIVTAYSG